MKRHFGKRALRRIICIAIVVLIAIPFSLSAFIYEKAFGQRWEPESWMEYSVSDFDGLHMERSDFLSDGITLAGYRYFGDCDTISGVVIVAHGMGGGGQNEYMPVIDYFVSNGFYVFAYDARGNGNSGGANSKGFPQGVIDLDSAITHAETIDEYQGLPILLFGHSWGAYSSACVLALHPEIKAAAIISGCNDSMDLIQYYGNSHAGAFGSLLLPYMRLYEAIKFGAESAGYNAVDGMASCDADIIIVHSSDDTTVPTQCGYDRFYAAFADDDRFEFVLYADKGHGYVYCSDAALEYQAALNAEYTDYIEGNDLQYNAENKEAFMLENLDKAQCFEPDPDLMQQIVELYLQ